MIKYIELLAENIVDFFDSKKKKKKNLSVTQNNDNAVVESVDYICYEIVPYHLNDL